MEIVIAVCLGLWFVLAGGFTTFMVCRDFNRVQKNSADKKEAGDE